MASLATFRLLASAACVWTVVGCGVPSNSETPSEREVPSASAASTPAAPPPTPEAPSGGEALDEMSVPSAASLEAPLGPPADLADASLAKLVEKFEGWAKRNRAELGLAVVDVDARRIVASSSADAPRNPASNQKLFTAAAALVELGPEYRFRTEVGGNPDENGVVPELVLRGGGAPDFTTADVVRMARALTRLGVTRVEKLLVDQSRFDTPFVPPAFEQQPSEWAAFRAPISALAIDRNTITLDVVPGREGESARVYYDPPGVVLGAGAPTTEKGDRDRVTWTLEKSPKEARLSSRVGGSLGLLAGRRRYTRRMDDPRLAPGYAFAEILREFGVQIEGEPELGERTVGRLVHWDSAPVRRLVFDLGKDSDNFVAEMLFVALSVRAEGEANARWSSARGAEALKKFSRKLLPSDVAEALSFRNGSGLFDANRVTPRSLALLLAEMTRHGEVFPEFLSQLAIGGVDGTLAKRFVDVRGKVRAKTGTLRDTIALSGYADRSSKPGRYAFSILVSGGPSAIAGARNAIDQFVSALVRGPRPEAP